MTAASSCSWTIKTIDGHVYLSDHVDQEGDAVRFVGRLRLAGGQLRQPGEYIFPAARLKVAYRPTNGVTAS